MYVSSAQIDRGIPGTLLLAQHAELSFYHQPSPTHGEAAIHVESSGSRASERGREVAKGVQG